MELFEEVCEALRGLVPPELGTFRHKTHRYGTKIWFGPEAPPKEHYEAQVVGARDVPEAEVLAIEVGFHSEYPKDADNEVVLSELLAAESAWRPELGDEAVADVFLGRADNWRRISETWPDPDLEDPELGTELAMRLLDYIEALEPLRNPLA
ncbi:MAG TPA: hypothetical protein VIT24_11445 [Acidimicrobiales bacterium]